MFLKIQLILFKHINFKCVESVCVIIEDSISVFDNTKYEWRCRQISRPHSSWLHLWQCNFKFQTAVSQAFFRFPRFSYHSQALKGENILNFYIFFGFEFFKGSVFWTNTANETGQQTGPRSLYVIYTFSLTTKSIHKFKW